MYSHITEMYLQKTLDSTREQLKLLRSQLAGENPVANLEPLIASAEAVERDFELLLANNAQEIKILVRLSQELDGPVEVSMRSTAPLSKVVLVNHLINAPSPVEVVQVEGLNEVTFNEFVFDELAPFLQNRKIDLVNLLASLNKK